MERIKVWDPFVRVFHWSLVAGLITLHICGVIASSYVHRENLILAMITGKKKVPRD